MLNTNANRGGLALASAVKELYGEGKTDYHLEPIVLVDEQGQPVGRISDGDAVIFCCRRGEREIELTEAFTQADFPHFPRSPLGKLDFVILTLYHEKFAHLPIAFAPSMIPATLGEVVSQAGLRQLRAAESEKFAHVTFFLNGGNNQAFPGETDVSIPSPKGIPFEQVPELSLPEVTRQVLGGIEQEYDLIVTNFANGDVIGHTSSREAKICCAEYVDTHLGQLVQAALAKDYVVFVTADHGNLEELWNPDGAPHVAHTNNRVELILLDGRPHQPAQLRNGILADIAPTILSALGCNPSASMTGSSLVSGADWGGKRRVLLVILDGWGIGQMDATNPIYLGRTPVWNDLLRRYPSCCLEASGEAVGLQADKPGNSEAGHMNIGAGRVVEQDDVRLDLSLQDGSFYQNETFCRVIEQTRQRGANLHLLALLTEKSSHGSIDYPLAILKIAKERGLEKVYLHMIFDGRSTAPGSAPALLEMLEAKMNAIGLGQIVTGVGRGLALDRDGNYGRIQRVYTALVAGEGRHAPLFAHSQAYQEPVAPH